MPDTVRLLTAWGATLAYGGLCAAVYLRHRRRQRIAVAPLGDGGRPVLVAYASQSGSAEALAQHTARSLGAAGLNTTLVPLNRVTPALLAAHEQALFLVSTCGEGDAPDNGALFERHCMADAGPDLSRLHVGVLALGDREYAHFCAFGRRLAAWLEARGAVPLFAPLEMDNQDANALAAWQQQVAHIAGSGETPDWRAPAFTPWRLLERRHLNPGSSGAPVFHLALAPEHGPLPEWQAGDLVQVQPPEAGEQPRDYSIASLPADGALHLLVRLQARPDGTPGLASGHLCKDLEVGRSVALRLKAHANFRLGDNAGRPLILIGNGTGIAGLRGHLKARAQHATTGGAWLLFGERTRAHDALYDADLQAWLTSGVLTRLDRAFSRDGDENRYVQSLVAEHARPMADWVDRGAYVYVCGSLEGMSKGVHAALEAALGEERLTWLTEAGRYRRDVY